MKKKIESSCNIWEYLYYRTTLFYRKHESRFGFEDNKERGAWSVAIFCGINLLSILSLFLFFFNKTSFLKNYLSYFFVVISLLVLYFSTTYFKRNHDRISSKYKNEDNKQRNVRGNLLLLYIMFSLVLMFVVVYAGNKFWK